MNPPRRKQRGITERGFATVTAGGIHPRGKPRGIEPSRLRKRIENANARALEIGDVAGHEGKAMLDCSGGD